jgi:hypothetical protein
MRGKRSSLLRSVRQDSGDQTASCSVGAGVFHGARQPRREGDHSYPPSLRLKMSAAVTPLFRAFTSSTTTAFYPPSSHLSRISEECRDSPAELMV